MSGIFESGRRGDTFGKKLFVAEPPAPSPIWLATSRRRLRMGPNRLQYGAIWGALAAAGALSLTAANADCDITYDQARSTAVAAQRSEPHARYSEFGAEAAAALLRTLDTQSGTGVDVDRLLVTERPDIDTVRIAVVMHDCVVGVGSVSQAKWRSWRALAFGAGS
jgi:hypothetical protein